MLWTGKAVAGQRASQSDVVEEAYGTADLVEPAEGNPLQDQLDEKAADLLGIEAVGRCVVIGWQSNDRTDVGLLSVGGEIAHLHVLEQALPERCHGNVLG